MAEKKCAHPACTCFAQRERNSALINAATLAPRETPAAATIRPVRAAGKLADYWVHSAGPNSSLKSRASHRCRTPGPSQGSLCRTTGPVELSIVQGFR